LSVKGRKRGNARLRAGQREAGHVIEPLGEAEVRHPHPMLRMKEDLRRLEIPMHDPVRLRMLDGLRNLLQPPRHPPKI
jgi:hypothetical protein